MDKANATAIDRAHMAIIDNGQASPFMAGSPQYVGIQQWVYKDQLR
jgi:hypothetical protein